MYSDAAALCAFGVQVDEKYLTELATYRHRAIVLGSKTDNHIRVIDPGLLKRLPPPPDVGPLSPPPVRVVDPVQDE